MAVSEQTLATGKQLDMLCINTIRTLAMDAVQKANSGHPGAPMALAPVAYCLWQQFLRYDPEDPVWPNRDRFVLSNGHASMLLYAMLYLAEVRGINPEYERKAEFAVTLDDVDSTVTPHPLGRKWWQRGSVVTRELERSGREVEIRQSLAGADRPVWTAHVFQQ